MRKSKHFFSKTIHIIEIADESQNARHCADVKIETLPSKTIIQIAHILLFVVVVVFHGIAQPDQTRVLVTKFTHRLEVAFVVLGISCLKIRIQRHRITQDRSLPQAF